MIYFLLFILGAVIGSFLNVVALRWDNLSSTKIFSRFRGRSKCPHCQKILRWWELVPIVSFFALRARCSGCQSKISWQYPLIEIWTGLLFVTVPPLLIPIFLIYVVILIYDWHHKIIPDSLVYVAVFLSALVPIFFTTYTVIDWLAGPILFTFFAFIWLLSRGRAMGFGDAKLGLSVGLLLGASQGFSAIVLAFWLGAIVSLFYILFKKIGFIKDAKSLTMKSEVPFAPAIIVGAWLSLVFDLNLLHVISF